LRSPQRLLPRFVVCCLPVLASTAWPVVFAASLSTPEVRRDGPLPAQAVGAVHTLRIIPETCRYLRGRFTGDARAPYAVDVVARGGRCQARARLRAVDTPPAGGGWQLNDVLRVPHAACPGFEAAVTIWRRSGGNLPPARDAQGRARLYLQDEKRRAERSALEQLGEYVYLVATDGAGCAR